MFITSENIFSLSSLLNIDPFKTQKKKNKTNNLIPPLITPILHLKFLLLNLFLSTYHSQFMITFNIARTKCYTTNTFLITCQRN